MSSSWQSALFFVGTCITFTLATSSRSSSAPSSTNNEHLPPRARVTRNDKKKRKKRKMKGPSLSSSSSSSSFWKKHNQHQDHQDIRRSEDSLYHDDDDDSSSSSSQDHYYKNDEHQGYYLNGEENVEDVTTTTNNNNNSKKKKNEVLQEDHGPSMFYPFLVRARHRLSFDATATATAASTIRTTATATALTAADDTQMPMRERGEQDDTKFHSHNNHRRSKRVYYHHFHQHLAHHDHFQLQHEHDLPTSKDPPTRQSCTTPKKHSAKSRHSPSLPCLSTKKKSTTTSKPSNNHHHIMTKDGMKSFDHFHEMIQYYNKNTIPTQQLSSSSSTSSSSTPLNALLMEQVQRRYTTGKQMLMRQQAGCSFNSTYCSSYSENHHHHHENTRQENDPSAASSSSSSSCSSSSSSSHSTTPHDDFPHASHFSAWRSNYNSKIMPHRVILVRHGQSEGNVNEAIYAEKPDSEIPLTQLGWEQARMAGMALRHEILCHMTQPQQQQQNVLHKNNNNKRTMSLVHFIVSPYVRTMETFHGLVSAWCDPDVEFGHVQDENERKILWYNRLAEMGITWHEDPRIREQDFGNYQEQHVIDKAKMERHKFGAFYYRFPNGESASDVYDRASTFLDSLWRSFDANRSRNYVLVTHGISVRVLLMRYFRYSIDQFYMVANPRNCEMVLLGHDGHGKLQLEGRCDLEFQEEEGSNGHSNTNATSKRIHNTLLEEEEQSGNDEQVVRVHGYKFYKRLRVVPSHHMRKRAIRLSYQSRGG